jgi:hypothetical protein
MSCRAKKYQAVSNHGESVARSSSPIYCAAIVTSPAASTTWVALYRGTTGTGIYLYGCQDRKFLHIAARSIIKAIAVDIGNITLPVPVRVVYEPVPIIRI